MRLPLFLWLLTGASVRALQLPFNIPFFKTKGPALIDTQDYTPRIAIIGAGAGGSSAAFWIGKAKERFDIQVEVDVYEKSDYIGGRSTIVYPYNDTSLPPMELGASIFVEANKNLWRASNEFNLTRKYFDEDEDLGIWDGERFLLTLGGGKYTGSWWSTIKVLWRYGYYAPTRTNTIVQNMVKHYIDVYTLNGPKWENISSLAEELDWTYMAAQTASEYLDSQGVSKKYSREMVEAATRVNYGQNLDEINMVGGGVSMASNGAVGIGNGNYQIFEQFLNRSGARVFLNTAVTSISQKPSSRHWTIHSAAGSADYKAIVLATPFHHTKISLPTSLSSPIPPQPYVHLHVTLLTTTSPSVSPEYFGLAEGAKVPKMVLTSWEGAREGGRKPEFNSLTYHGVVRGGELGEGETEWGVKIFSKERVEDEWLEKVFRGKVGWVYRKEWDAYPFLRPATEFPPVKVDQGLYYVNAFEPFISTMETETVASRNVVDLLLNEEFGSGICGPRIDGSSKKKVKEDKDFVFGWDC